MIAFKRAGKESGKTMYHVECNRRGFLGVIRFFDKKAVRSAPHAEEGWAWMNKNGRTDFYDSLDEAKSDALKA